MAIKRITTNLIEDGSIGTIDIANNAITAAKITDGNITTAKLADLNVTAGKLAGTLDLTGKTITVATATTGDSDTSPASTAFVQQEIAALVDSSPSSLNTLNELAAALGDDASFSTTVTNSIATKLPLAGGTMTGDLKVGATIASTGGTTNNRGILLAHQNNTNQSYVGRSENGVADTGNRITFDYDNDKMQLDSDGDIILTPTSNVGIGTSSPISKLHIDGAENNTGGITLTAGAQAHNWYLASDFVNVHDIGTGSASAAHTWHINGSEKMRLDASGNVGIGTSSPDTLLELSKAAGTGTSLAKLANTSSAATSNISQIDFELSNTFSGANVDVQIGAIKTNAGNEESAFYINTTSGTGTPTEAMRIDSSGNLLVNKTASGSLGTAGFEFASNNTLRATKGSSAPAEFNRLTNDGNIALFYKDTSPVGSIGAYQGSIYIQGNSNSSGFLFGNNNVYPWDAGALSDANIELGSLDYRFKKLYLSDMASVGHVVPNTAGTYTVNHLGVYSDGITVNAATSETGYLMSAGTGIVSWNGSGGKIKLGGTAAANELDDYEEGTWTPTFSGATLSTANGFYIKTGGQVTVYYHIVTTGGLPSSGTPVRINDLPFNSAGNNISSGSQYCTTYNVSNSSLSSYMGSSYDHIRFININGTSFDYTLMGELEVTANNSITLVGTFTYRT